MSGTALYSVQQQTAAIIKLGGVQRRLVGETFGLLLMASVVHGLCSAADVRREIEMFFSKDEVFQI